MPEVLDVEIYAVIGALMIFLARLVNVSIGTVRNLLAMRGQKRIATVLGFFESLIYILAVSQVLQNVGNVWNILGYCGGFAVGTYVGLWVEEKMALGYAIVKVVNVDGLAIASALRERGFGVTETTGRGLYSEVSVLTSVARRRDTKMIMSVVRQVDPTAFITIEDADRVVHGHLAHA